MACLPLLLLAVVHCLSSNHAVCVQTAWRSSLGNWVKLAINQPLEATGLLSLPASLVKVGLSNCASVACLLCTVLHNTNMKVLL
jgi:hypothetical protein